MEKLILNIKTILLLLAAVLILPAISNAQDAVNSSDSTAQQDTINLGTFQKALPPDQGEWIKVNPNEVDSGAVTDDNGMDDDICQDYVWRPNGVPLDWCPYTNGYWELTDCGWQWVSYYSWGWAPYHYGRWWWSAGWGWVWSPGYVWAPCWVSWCYNDGYCGWYPLSPRCRWHHGYDIDRCRFRNEGWTFVSYQNFNKVTVTHNTIINTTKHPEVTLGTKTNDISISGGKVINKGPNVTDIEKSTGQKVSVRSTDNIKKIPTSVTKQLADNKSVLTHSTKPQSVQTKTNSNNNGQKNRNNGSVNSGRKNNTGVRGNHNNSNGNKNNSGYKSRGRNNGSKTRSGTHNNGSHNNGSHKSGHSKGSHHSHSRN